MATGVSRTEQSLRECTLLIINIINIYTFKIYLRTIWALPTKSEVVNITIALLQA